MNPAEMKKYQALYLQTAQQYLQSYLANVQGLAQNQTQKTVLEQILIAVHSIKSQSLVMGYDRLGNYCKDLEQFVRGLLAANAQISPEQVARLQSAQEVIRKELSMIASTGEDVAGPETTTNQSSVVGIHKKILLVEDDSFFEKFYAYKLTQSGFSVAVAKNGQEGLDKMREENPDIILLDLIMPIKDGFTFLKEKASLTVNGLNRIPVIVFSTLGQEEDITKAKSLGAAGYVNKSFFEYDTLLHTVTSLIGT